MNKIYGYVHSIASLGGADGPGVRTVIFMQGCPLRCSYCHNPDTWKFFTGEKYRPEELFNKVSRYKPYFGSSGGVTVSGGEPLSQPEFVAEFFKLCRKNGIHTALDTAGSILNDKVKKVLDYTDLVLLDVKHTNPLQFRELTRGEYSSLMEFLDYCIMIKKPLWLRQVIVPGITDSEENIRELAVLAKKAGALKVELLPYHDMGVYKWEELGLEYKLKGVEPPSPEQMEKLNKILRASMDFF